EEEEREFYQNNLEKIAFYFEPIEGACKYIKLLRNLGHEIYIISGRDNGEYSKPREMTEEWLSKYDIEYDELILTNAYNTHEKTDICLKNNIKILIDDSQRTCMDAYYFGIDALIMDMPHNRDNTVLTRVHNWKEIYEYVINYRREKYKVILDTDTFNESDDQFALAYIFKSQDIFDIEAITIAPFRNKARFYEDSGIERSYAEARKICDLLGINNFDKIYKGSTDYIMNGYDEVNKAVEKIIEIALRNDKTYILGIAAITNVALAIKKEPRIVDKIEIIWLGGHAPMYPNNLNEANFRDVDAVRIIFESKVKLTVIPCKGVASNLETTLFELKANMDEGIELNKYLIDGFDRYINTYRHEQRWPIWDIAVIAYMINPMWFVRKNIKVPNISSDYTYIDNVDSHEMTIITYLSSNKIYKDLFEKLGRNDET
ncbi:MAG: nucleoside hydrolase, partial [Bacilli bacterium]|nr:nucleoside hydrolase [Bacilli bacterium]